MSLTFEQAAAGQERYRTNNPDILERLGDVGIVAYAGPNGAGKTYQVRHSGLAVPINMGTRLARTGEEKFVHVPMDEMLEKIERQEVVQYGALPETHTIYATDINSYQEGRMHAKEITVRGVAKLSMQGFGVVRPIGVVPYPHDLTERLEKRFTGMSIDERAGRLDHTESTLEVLVDEWAPSDKHLLIISSDELTERNTELVSRFIATGYSEDRENNDHAKLAAILVLTQMQGLRKKFLGGIK